VGALAFVEVLQVRQGLKVVGVQALLVDLHVGLDVVGEDLDLQVHAFLGQGRLDQFEDFRVRHRRGGDHQFFSGVGEARERQGGGQGGGQQGLFHGDPCSIAGPSQMASRVPIRSGGREPDNTDYFYSVTISFT